MLSEDTRMVRIQSNITTGHGLRNHHLVFCIQFNRNCAFLCPFGLCPRTLMPFTKGFFGRVRRRLVSLPPNRIRAAPRIYSTMLNSSLSGSLFSSTDTGIRRLFPSTRSALPSTSPIDIHGYNVLTTTLPPELYVQTITGLIEVLIDQITCPETSTPMYSSQPLSASENAVDFDLIHNLTSTVSTPRPTRSLPGTQAFKAVELLCERSPVSLALIDAYFRRICKSVC